MILNLGRLMICFGFDVGVVGVVGWVNVIGLVVSNVEVSKRL